MHVNYVHVLYYECNISTEEVVVTAQSSFQLGKVRGQLCGVPVKT